MHCRKPKVQSDHCGKTDLGAQASFAKHVLILTLHPLRTINPRLAMSQTGSKLPCGGAAMVELTRLVRASFPAHSGRPLGQSHAAARLIKVAVCVSRRIDQFNRQSELPVADHYQALISILPILHIDLKEVWRGDGHPYERWVVRPSKEPPNSFDHNDTR